MMLRLHAVDHAHDRLVKMKCKGMSGKWRANKNEQTAPGNPTGGSGERGVKTAGKSCSPGPGIGHGIGCGVW